MNDAFEWGLIVAAILLGLSINVLALALGWRLGGIMPRMVKR